MKPVETDTIPKPPSHETASKTDATHGQMGLRLVRYWFKIEHLMGGHTFQDAQNHPNRDVEYFLNRSLESYEEGKIYISGFFRCAAMHVLDE
ncbi:hypothetical protein [Endozoicomonas sp.]|uniref:hypothetical protein n=1 Tax=Endozoicomonas sp. TaxID=1892382 RepID=UPI00383A3146